jgi:hypothetical protein
MQAGGRSLLWCTLVGGGGAQALICSVGPGQRRFEIILCSCKNPVDQLLFDAIRYYVRRLACWPLLSHRCEVRRGKSKPLFAQRLSLGSSPTMEVALVPRV